MNIGGLIAKLLIINAASAHIQNNNIRWRESATNAVEQYYMSYFGEIFLQDERNWILNEKIKPLVSKMSDKQLGKILSIKDKNNKRVKRNKPVKTILVKKETIEQYNLEYQDHLREEKIKKENAIKRQRQEYEARIQRAKTKEMYDKYVYENGESDVDLIKKLF